MDFLHRLTEIAAARELALLPSPYATVLRDGDRTLLLGPHDRVRVLTDVAAGAVMTCTPSLLKAMAGHPRSFVDAALTTREVPLLRPFDDHDVADWPTMVRDLRSAVDVTGDEEQFAGVWAAITGHGRATAGTVDQRQAERLCRRYAGQTPSRILRQLRLAAQLAADIAAGEYRPLGRFADQSHYIRESRRLTGHTPRHWRSSGASFRRPDGGPVEPGPGRGAPGVPGHPSPSR